MNHEALQVNGSGPAYPDVMIHPGLLSSEAMSKEMGDELKRLGLVTGAGVIQCDVVVVNRKLPDSGTVYDGAICDHNCDIEGGYQCPARFSANRGLSLKDITPAEKINQAIDVAAEGLRQFNKTFVTGGDLIRYASAFQIPNHIQAGIAYNMLKGPVNINIFGGNPELHPEVLSIAKYNHNQGRKTTLTTTGGALMNGSPQRREAFIQAFDDGLIDVLAVSAEFTSPEQILRYADMSTEELKEEWRKTSPLYGQKRKGLEALNALKLHTQGQGKNTLLLNMVVHPGNLGTDGENIEKIISAISALDPKAIINPYPAQSSFGEPFDKTSNENRSNIQAFTADDIPGLCNFIGNRLAEQTNTNSHTTRRPHYWAMLQSVVDTNYDDETKARMLSGHEIWICYSKDGIPGAGQSVQIGASPYPRDPVKMPYAGGKLACYWNDRTTTDDRQQVWDMSPAAIANHIANGMSEIANSINNPCPGCIMPRLVGDEPSLELGLNPLLKVAYLARRKSLVGF